MALDVLVMLGMLAGHAGDVENDADDVDGLAQNTYISQENAVTYSIFRMENKKPPKKQPKKITPASTPNSKKAEQV